MESASNSVKSASSTGKEQENHSSEEESIIIEEEYQDIRGSGVISMVELEARRSLSLDYSNRRPLPWSEVEQLQQEHGKNVIDSQKLLPWYRILFNGLIHPFNFVLSILAIVSGATQDFRTMTVMFIMILLSVIIRFVQEMKSERKAQGLKNLVQNKVTVIRELPPTEGDVKGPEIVNSEFKGVKQEILLEDVVPGDLVFLSAGDMIPGDLEIVASKDLFVSQSALTGEALPVEKYPLNDDAKVKKFEEEKKQSGRGELDRPDFCFMGTSVVSGTATGVVMRIGSKTSFGEMAEKLNKARPQNAFEKGVKRVSFMFLGIMAVMGPIVLIISGFVQGNWFDAFLFTIAVAVGLTPEMLPMIVNSNLALGGIILSRKRVIVKRLDSVINLGAMDVLCTDKTGTLTQNKVVLIKHLGADGNQSTQTLTMAYLNSSFQTGLKNLLDIAVTSYFKENHERDPIDDYEKLDEIPFDFVRRRMSVLVKEKKTGKKLLICKGAVDEMLSSCTRLQSSGKKPEKLTEERRKEVEQIAEELNSDGLRAVAVAIKSMPGEEKELKIKDECKMCFLGFIAFLDPPKESAAEAIQNLMERGVEVKVLTGDSPLVCLKVCQQLKLPVKMVVNSRDLKDLDEEKLTAIAEGGTIFARLTPVEKSDIVRVLRKKHVVGFIGDGINDAVALHSADVGISVDDGTDVAKESASIILLEKSLLILSKGVDVGRKTYCNTIKYIKMAVSSNFGNVFSVTIASAWLPFLPMLPIHIVFQNLLYDLSQLAIPWDNVDPDFLAIPRNWETKSILRFMACIGPISSIFDMTTFSFMWYYYGIQTPEDHVLLFQTAWFVEGLLTQSLIIHMIRTPHIPFFQSTASLPVLIGTFLVMAICVALPFTPLNTFLQMAPLPGLYFLYLVGALSTYGVLTNVGKLIYLRLFGDWL